MQIHGVDFTSAPGPRKPITWAEGKLAGTKLEIGAVHEMHDFGAFEAMLSSPGPWVVAMDFPFGLPAETVAALAWPASWAGYVAEVALLSADEFYGLLETERSRRPQGEKYRYRPADRRARSASPMNAQYPPVAKMFFRGAPILLRSRCSVPPHRPNGDARVVVEGYPKLVARFCIGDAPYKGRPGARHRSTALQEAEIKSRRARRRRIVQVITGERRGVSGARLVDVYGCTVSLEPSQRRRLCADSEADLLDAVLDAIEAAWAYSMRRRNYGIPLDCDPNEGWIVDPGMLT